MKSSPDVVSDWNPPELNEKRQVQRSSLQQDQTIAMFRMEEAPKPVPLHKGAGNTFLAWQPGTLDVQAEVVEKDSWSFLEVFDTPDADLGVPQIQKNAPEGPARRESRTEENEASRILAQARRQAEEIILSAQAVADDTLLQTQTEIDEQKKLGYQQGKDDAQAELAQTLRAVRKMSQEVQNWHDQLVSQGEDILVVMLKDIARKMFGEGVKLDPETLHVHLNQVMENARGLGVLKIFLNPNDARLLDPSWGEQQMLSLGEQVKIVPSGNITRGGCLIKGNIGTVDARVETQLESILKTFEEAGRSAE